MEIPVKFMVERLQKLPNHAFVITDGSKVFAAVEDKLVIFEGEVGEFNRMTENELGEFIQANWDKKGAPVVENPEFQEGDWFIDTDGEEDQVWECGYVGEDMLGWVKIPDRSTWKPLGRNVMRPSFAKEEERAQLSADVMYEDGDWFVILVDEVPQVWELQGDLELGYSTWKEIIYPNFKHMSGKRIPKPPFPGIPPSQAADFILDDSKWGTEEETNDDDQGHGASRDIVEPS